MLRAFFYVLLGAVFCGLLMQMGYAEDGAPENIEINPSEYVPLAVGNSWTYEHSYWNNSYSGEATRYDIEYLKPFEIPRYPHGEGNALPPDSLLLPVDRVLTIEITHTERIDGREYFVFSDAEYDWPPLPDFFWAGKKVRLSDEGVLVFRWNGQEVLIFDFGELINLRGQDWLGYTMVIQESGYTTTLPEESAPPVDINRSVLFYKAPNTSKLHYLVHFEWYRWEADRWWGLGSRFCHFLQGYGIGRFSEAFYGLHWPIFENILTGLSVNIDGEEIWHDQLDPDGQPPAPEPIAVGKLAQQNVFGLFPGLRILPTKIDTISDYQGFDFSAGSTGSYDGDYLREGKHDFGIYQLTGLDGVPTTPGYFSNPPGVEIVDLDVYLVDGIFTPTPPTGYAEIIEGHTYAVWPHDGGLALMYVFYVGLHRPSPPLSAGGSIADVVIEWMYDPEWTYGSPTAIKATSWGRLKSNILRGP